MKSNFLNNLNKVFFKKKYSIFSFAFDFLGKKKTIFVILILAFLGIVGSLVSTIIPLFLQNIIEELEKILNQNIVEKELFSKFVFSAMMIIIIYLVKFLFCDVPNTIFTSIFDQQITFSLRKRMFEKIPKIPFSYYEKTSQGHIITLLVHDTQNISNTFLGGISGIFSSIIIFFGTTISMLIIN
jgi:ATP-binding cassette subfamily B protein